MQEIIEQLKKEDYKIEQIATGENAITGITLDKASMSIGFGKSKEIKVTLKENSEQVAYYAIVDGKYYKMNLNDGAVKIERTESKVSNTGGTTTLKLTVTSSDEKIATVSIDDTTNIITVTGTNKGGTVTITVTYGESIEPQTCEVTVKDMPVATALEMNSVRARIAIGYTRWLGATTTPVSADQEFKWTSSDESIATVNNKGVVTAKKAGKVKIKAETTDESNKAGECEVTVVENATDIASLTDEIQEKNIVAKDENGNLITVPGNFRVLTELGTKVTDGIVIQDEEGNEFVWVPIDSVSTGTDKIADDIRLGRYTFNNLGISEKHQDADNYKETVGLAATGYTHQELIESSTNTPAKNLGDFVTRTQENGGYYFGRYEASYKNDKQCYSMPSTSSSGSKRTANDSIRSYTGLTDRMLWNYVTQPYAAAVAQNSFSGYVESDLVNGYAWDTAIIFIQKYSGKTNYANQGTLINELVNTGKNGDIACNIHDMASNCSEWSTERFTNASTPCGTRGGYFNYSGHYTKNRGMASTTTTQANIGFRVLLYIKKERVEPEN